MPDKEIGSNCTRNASHKIIVMWQIPKAVELTRLKIRREWKPEKMWRACRARSDPTVFESLQLAKAEPLFPKTSPFTFSNNLIHTQNTTNNSAQAIKSSQPNYESAPIFPLPACITTWIGKRYYQQKEIPDDPESTSTHQFHRSWHHRQTLQSNQSQTQKSKGNTVNLFRTLQNCSGTNEIKKKLMDGSLEEVREEGTWEVDSVDAAMENGRRRRRRGLKDKVKERGKWKGNRPFKAVRERNWKVREGGATVAIVHRTSLAGRLKQLHAAIDFLFYFCKNFMC